MKKTQSIDAFQIFVSSDKLDDLKHGDRDNEITDNVKKPKNDSKLDDILEDLLNHNLSPAMNEFQSDFNSDMDSIKIFEDVRKGNVHSVEKFLESGGDINIIDKYSGATLLHIACSTGQLEIVKFLLRKGAFIESEDFKRRKPLHSAANEGHGHVVLELLTRGARVNSRDNFDRIPLHLAARNGDKQTCKHLLNFGSNIEARDCRCSWRPLHYACRVGSNDALHTLLTNGVKVNAQTKAGNTGLHLACDRCLVEKVKLLLEWGANPNLRNARGERCVDVIGEWGGLETKDLIARHFQTHKLRRSTMSTEVPGSSSQSFMKSQSTLSTGSQRCCRVQ
mmetsp:Transcript_932/g.1405  ORF Transcript_932/g.1405 Transcript_932/m.1405 type:complete len:336 (-) Transcript_932:180-1187(-)